MQALVAQADAAELVTLADVPEPVPGSFEAVVQQHRISLNRGEARALRRAARGAVLGWDVAGVVVTPAADGSGPSKGARVIGIVNGGGGWAERVAVPTRYLSEVPASLDLTFASALPIAGLTALWALSIGGALLGKRVLVTGAAGGVGRLAVQLAHRAGASVTAVVSRAERGAGLAELGADQVIVSEPAVDERYDLILESVGGESLAGSIRRIAEGGTVVLFGNSSDTNPTFDVEFYNRSRGAQIFAFNVMYELEARNVTRDLAWLAAEVDAGRLDPHVSLRTSWRNADDALRALRERRVAGEAVLDVD